MSITVMMMKMLFGSELDTCWASLVPPTQHPFTTYQYYIKQYMWSRSITKHLAGVKGCGIRQ